MVHYPFFVRDFSIIADRMVSGSNRVHAAVIVITALMIPGFLSSLTPIDIEAYNMDSPELEANDVMREEFPERETYGDSEYSFVLWKKLETCRRRSRWLNRSPAPHKE